MFFLAPALLDCYISLHRFWLLFSTKMFGEHFGWVTPHARCSTHQNVCLVKTRIFRWQKPFVSWRNLSGLVLSSKKLLDKPPIACFLWFFNHVQSQLCQISKNSPFLFLKKTNPSCAPQNPQRRCTFRGIFRSCVVRNSVAPRC